MFHFQSSNGDEASTSADAQPPVNHERGRNKSSEAQAAVNHDQGNAAGARGGRTTQPQTGNIRQQHPRRGAVAMPTREDVDVSSNDNSQEEEVRRYIKICAPSVNSPSTSEQGVNWVLGLLFIDEKKYLTILIKFLQPTPFYNKIFLV